MSKSILVIDTDSCKNCPAGRNLVSNNIDETWACEILSFMAGEIRGVDEYTDCKPDWCPLRVLPEKEDCKNYLDDDAEVYFNGWNSCIDKILGD